MFVRAEPPEALDASRRSEVERKLGLVRSWLEQSGWRAAVLAGSDAVAWLTGGLTSPVERGAAFGPLRLVVTAELFAAVTTNVERPRLAAEAGLELLGVALHEAPWFEPDSLDRAAVELAGGDAARLASDRPGLGADCGEQLVALRLALDPAERERLTQLALDATAALEGALRRWSPGERDLDLLARADEALERTGAFAACLIVGGDERVERFRHPLACGAAMERFVMAVVVAERAGLHVALTRFASAGALGAELRALGDQARSIEQAMLAASTAGSTYGAVMRSCDRGYAAVGQAGAWREHYQGGPVGYRQREFEIVPSQTTSGWYATAIEPGHALAWNPSLSGGGKVEDTYLVEAHGLRRLTDSGDWPLVAGLPAVLDVASGGPA